MTAPRYTKHQEDLLFKISALALTALRADAQNDIDARHKAVRAAIRFAQELSDIERVRQGITRKGQ